MAMESGVHSSVYPNCYRQISYTKFSLKIHCSASYKREIWHYYQANVDHIRKAVNLFPCEIITKSITKSILKSQRKQCDFLFNKTAENIISNYIPHETVRFDDRDRPWINKKA